MWGYFTHCPSFRNVLETGPLWNTAFEKIFFLPVSSLSKRYFEHELFFTEEILTLFLRTRRAPCSFFWHMRHRCFWNETIFLLAFLLLYFPAVCQAGILFHPEPHKSWNSFSIEISTQMLLDTKICFYSEFEDWLLLLKSVSLFEDSESLVYSNSDVANYFFSSVLFFLKLNQTLMVTRCSTYAVLWGMLSLIEASQCKGRGTFEYYWGCRVPVGGHLKVDDVHYHGELPDIG